MATKIQLRRDTSSSWSSVNPTLSQGEPGIETNTGKIKLGNGTTAWNCLPYLVTCGGASCTTWNTLGDKTGACGPNSVALGYEAGNSQSCYGAIAIGPYAGYQGQGYCAVAIGSCAGAVSQGNDATAIGAYAGSNLQSQGATAIGCTAGYNKQGAYSVAVGYNSARGYYQFHNYVSNCGTTIVLNCTGCIIAGMRVLGSGFNGTQRVNTVIDGTTVELTAPPCTTPSGSLQFVSNQCLFAIAIGAYAGSCSQSELAIAIGACAGANWQGCRGIAIGRCAGSNQQLADGIAIGTYAGYNAQCNDSIAIGTCAGYCHQGEEAIALGIHAGYSNQQRNAIALGSYAGSQTQGCSSVAIGHYAGQTCQGRSSVAIGFNAGSEHQGNNTIAIGHYAGYTNQVDNSIVLNASCQTLNATNAGFYINPVRMCACNISKSVYYDSTTKEITYGPSGSSPTWSSIRDINNTCGPTQVAIGRCAGNVSPGSYAVAIGACAGLQSCYGAVAVGAGAQYNSPNSEYSIAIGLCAAAWQQSYNAVAIGVDAGYCTQGQCTTAVGPYAGEYFQGRCAIAIGPGAGGGSRNCRPLESVCGSNIVVVCTGVITINMHVRGNGIPCGTTVSQLYGCNIIGLSQTPTCQALPGQQLTFTGGQNQGTIAIGKCAGIGNQQCYATAIGWQAGMHCQQYCAIAVGSCSGQYNQGRAAVAIGTIAGNSCQGDYAVALGYSAGWLHQGSYAIAIGYGAGESCQPANSIIINASGNNLCNANQGLYICPVRCCGSSTSNTVYYNTVTKEITYGPSGSGGIIIPTPVQTALGTPTVTITSTNGTGPCHADISISVASHAPVVSTGVVITAGACANAPVVAGTSTTGCQSITVTIPGTAAPFTAYAYLQTPFTTIFSAPVSGTSGICFVKGTLIALSDGTYKPIEDITYNDLLLVWDFDLGRYAEAHPLWIKAVETETKYNLLTFSDGSTLRTVGNHHIFNKQAKRFTHTMRDDTPIGTTTVNEYGNEITLVSAEEINETVQSYNVFTAYHLNMYANGILTSNRFNNTYPIEDMRFVKNGCPLRPMAEFAGIDQRWIDGLRLREQTSEHSTDYLHWYTQRLEYYDVDTPALLSI